MDNSVSTYQSPFKFLDAYQKEDGDIFFGREAEVQELYKMSFHTNLILVYGMSGTGKTSIIRCGLANCFDSSDWFDIYIRRQENINKAILRELRAKDEKKSFEKDFTLSQMVHSLYMDFLRPIYLIFDQFEELFILGKEEEQRDFIESIKTLLLKDLPCKIIIVMREEYLARLSGFEKEVPTLFEKRLRIEPMTRSNAREVIVSTAANPKFNIELCYEEIADDIIDNVTAGGGRVQLTYLQVFLDKMYRLAAEENPDHIFFDIDLVKKVGSIDDVLADFLEEQLAIFAKEVDRRDFAMRWLKLFVSEKGTKIPVNRHDLVALVPDMSISRLNIYLEFFVNRRILRPLDNDQFELSHDSLAAEIFGVRPQGIPMPRILAPDDQPHSPFVGFEPYPNSMAPFFYGRDLELKDLFDKVVNELGARTTLVFGPLGVGKTSLVCAGLMPRIEQLYQVAYIRSSREIIDSVLVKRMLAMEPNEGEEPLFLELAFQWQEKPPELLERKIIILDQFEEFFIWVPQQEELLRLYLHIATLLEARRNVDLIIVVRDEFFSQLQDLEAFIPNILEEQVRIRHVDEKTAHAIITNLLKDADMVVENDDIIRRIIQNVSEEDGKVNLTYLQLYLERLYEELK